MDIWQRMAKGVFDIAKKNIEDNIKIHIDDLGIINVDSVDGFELKIGETVRDNLHKRYMVVSEKTEFKPGILVSLNLVKKMWYHRLTYCPYSRSVSADGGCRIDTDSVSRTNGVSNTLKIHNIEEYLRSNPESIDGCPAPIHEFPAFDFVKHYGKCTYIPAIEELYDVFHNTEIQSLFRDAVAIQSKDPLLKEATFKIWSSTDNNNNRNLLGEEAFSLLLNSDQSVIVQSARKDEILCVVLFKRY